jgi:hypothetical protein
MLLPRFSASQHMIDLALIPCCHAPVLGYKGIRELEKIYIYISLINISANTNSQGSQNKTLLIYKKSIRSSYYFLEGNFYYLQTGPD